MHRVPSIKEQQTAIVASSGNNSVIEWINTKTAHCALVLQHFQGALALQIVDYYLVLNNMYIL